MSSTANSQMRRFRKLALSFTLGLLVTTAIGFAPSIATADEVQNPAYEKAVQSMQAKNYNDAIKSFDEAIGLQETNAKAYNLRGQCFFALKQYKLAVNDFGEAVKYDDDNAEYYLWKGSAEVKVNDHVSAVKDFEKAISLDPKLGKAYAGMGDSFRGAPSATSVFLTRSSEASIAASTGSVARRT